MSLQIWLPLNGDLHNQGLGSISATGTPIYKTNGKIGGNALDLKSRISITCPQIANLQTFSICFWAMAQSSKTLTDTWVDLIGFSDISSSETNGTFRWETCYNGSNKGIHWHDNATNAFVNGSHYHITSHDIWTHCCVVFNNITKKIYSYDNGALTATHTHLGGSFNSTGTFYLGQNNVIEGMIQDVRIYDHALSDKEVEEISKGLILHYKLDGISCPNKNLLTSNLKAYNPTEYNAYQLNLVEKLELNQPYTIQLWDVDVSHSGKTEAQLGLGIYFGGGYNRLYTWLGPQYFTNGHADYLSITFTETSWSRPADAQKLWLNIYNSPGNASGTRYMHIGAWKIEKGEVPTGWNQQENIVYDSSGYNNDGTIIGSLSAVADTPKYNCATYINGTNYISNIPIINSDGNLENEFSIFTWIKRKGDSSATNTIIYRGMVEFYIRENNTIRISWYAGKADSTYAENTWAPAGMTVPLDELVHVGFTFKNGVFKCYRNGIYLSNSNRPPYIRGSYSGDHYVGHQNYLDAELSDLRIYKTCLSDDQVKELYNTSVTIDNLGNIHAREFDENSNLNITKTGLFQANEIKDGNYQIASILKNTNSIQGNNLYEY